MEVLHIMDGPPLYTNCFLLVGNGGHAVAIDPNADAARFLDAAKEHGAALSHILLTHGHHDHVGSVEALRKATGAKVYLHPADAEQFGIQADEAYTDFGEIVVDDMTFKVLFTPGHTPGSVVIACGDLLFAGDTLFAGDIGRTDLPGGNAAQMRESLKKIVDNITDDLQVLPGHEEFSTMSAERAHNPYLQF